MTHFLDENNAEKTTVVVGDGWAALATVAHLTTRERRVVWVSGTSSKIHPVLPMLDDSRAADLLISIAASLEIDLGERTEGNFLREFRNKSFREADSAELKARLWDAEAGFVPADETFRFTKTLPEIENEIREKLASERYPNLKRVVGVPVMEIKSEAKKVTALVLASGETIECSAVVFADRWNSLASIEGLPKPLLFLRKRNPVGVLQAVFTHDAPAGGVPDEAFFTALNKDSGDAVDRNVWGYMNSQGNQSYWTVCIAAEEAEDNHQIAKKLRKLKSSTEKMFAGTEFLANIREEQVRFHESIIFTEGQPLAQPITLKEIDGLYFVTDGYGVSSALDQVGSLFGSERTNAKTEDMHRTDTVSP